MITLANFLLSISFCFAKVCEYTEASVLAFSSSFCEIVYLWARINAAGLCRIRIDMIFSLFAEFIRFVK